MILNKNRAIFMVASVILAITILSTSISPRQFEHTMPMDSIINGLNEQAESNPLNDETAGSGVSITVPNSFVEFFRLIFVRILVPASILYGIFTKEGRKRIQRSIIAIAVIMITYNIAGEKLFEALTGVLAIFSAEASESAEAALTPLREVHPILLFLISLGILMILGVLGRVLYTYLIKPLFIKKADFASSAQNALNDLDKGTSWQNAIVQCYADMSDQIKETKGIERETTFTPREFETYLIQDGIPAQPIQQLTRLFEEARYSPQTANSNKINEAKQCLTAILTTLQPINN